MLHPIRFRKLRCPTRRRRHAQSGKVHRIGFLRDGQPPQSYVEAFQQGLREWGYVDGRNVVIEFRIGRVDQMLQLAEELVRLKVDVIVASSTPAAIAAKKATTSVPIIFVNVYDPVEVELVPSLARPGGNITGLAFSAGHQSQDCQGTEVDDPAVAAAPGG